jgi:hypothetical protein
LFLFVQPSALEIPNVDKRGACAAHHEEFSDNFLQKFQPLMQFVPQISFCHFSLSLAHAGHLLHLLTLMDDHYADHRQSSRVRHGSFNASHTSEILSLICHRTLAATWLMSALVISAAKHEIY